MATASGIQQGVQEALRLFERLGNGTPVALGASAVVFVLGLAVHQLLFALLRRFAKKTTTDVDDRLVERMRPALLLLVVLLSLHTFVLVRAVPIPALRTAVVIAESLVAVYLVVELIETLVVHYWLSERQGVRVPAVVRHLVLVVLYLAVGLSIVGSVTGVDLVPILATSTVLTVVLGLALQDTLGNLVSGLALHFERPFTLGDWVMIDGTEGEIVHLGWRSAHMRTLSDDIVALPNSVIARGRIQNFYAPNRRTARRIDFLVKLGSPAPDVERAVLHAAERVPRVLAEPKLGVWLVGMSPLALRYSVRFFMEDFRTHDDVESDFLKAIVAECVASGLSLEGTAVAAAAENT